MRTVPSLQPTPRLKRAKSPATVAPRGAPPTPGPRLLEWRTPKTNSAPKAR